MTSSGYWPCLVVVCMWRSFFNQNGLTYYHLPCLLLFEDCRSAILDCGIQDVFLQWGLQVGQWGSSQAAFPWPKTLLKAYIEMAKARGIRVVADEIMCGLGRHGQGSFWRVKDDRTRFRGTIKLRWRQETCVERFGCALAMGRKLLLVQIATSAFLSFMVC